MPIATLIAAKTLNAEDVAAAESLLAGAGVSLTATEWLDEGKAADIGFDGDRARASNILEPLRSALDIIVVDQEMRDVRLVVSDMDSTMIAAECIDELADYANVKPEIAAITERAMRGELDFEAALRERVARLKGLSEHAISDCLGQRIRPMPGARTLIATLSARGADCVLVSGGFHQFADVIGAELGFDAVYANRLVIEHGHLTGGLEGTIVDAARKAEILRGEIARQGLAKSQSLSLGDGANDIPMMREAGLSIAYHGKPAAREAALGSVDHGDLTAVLYALGIPSAQWVE